MSMRGGLCLIGVALAWPLLVGGCPPPADDSLEPNDSRSTATLLTPDAAVEGRAVQLAPDVFAVVVGTAGTIVFTIEDLGGQDCPDLTVTADDGTVLYADGRHTCGFAGAPAVQVEGAERATLGQGGYRLTVPAPRPGTYYLEIRELPYADNVVPNAWDYRVTATLS